MDLKTWRKKKKLSYAAVAQLLGEYMTEAPSPTSVQSWENGTEPRVSAALAIEKLTKGRVKANGWG